MKPWFVWRNGGATVVYWLTMRELWFYGGDGAAAQRYTEARIINRVNASLISTRIR